MKRASAVSPSRRRLVRAPAGCLTPKPSLLHRLGAGSRGDTSRRVSEQSRAWGLVQTAGSVVFRLGVLGEATSPAEPPSCLRTRTTPALTPQGYREPRTISHAPSAYNKQHPGPRGRYLSGGRSGPPCLCSPLRRVPTRSAAAEASGGQTGTQQVLSDSAARNTPEQQGETKPDTRRRQQGRRGGRGPAVLAGAGTGAWLLDHS